MDVEQDYPDSECPFTRGFFPEGAGLSDCTTQWIQEFLKIHRRVLQLFNPKYLLGGFLSKNSCPGYLPN